jgi:hypothetical protein
MREIVTIQLGHAGNQIGCKVYVCTLDMSICEINLKVISNGSLEICDSLRYAIFVLVLGSNV